MKMIQELVNMQSAVSIMKGLAIGIGEDLKKDDFEENVINNFKKIEYELNLLIMEEVKKHESGNREEHTKTAN